MLCSKDSEFLSRSVNFSGVVVVAKTLSQVSMQSGGHAYRLRVVNKGVATSPGSAALRNASDLVVNVPNWTFLEY